jgi:hypothetical protein
MSADHRLTLHQLRLRVLALQPRGELPIGHSQWLKADWVSHLYCLHRRADVTLLPTALLHHVLSMLLPPSCMWCTLPHQRHTLAVQVARTWRNVVVTASLVNRRFRAAVSPSFRMDIICRFSGSAAGHHVPVPRPLACTSETVARYAASCLYLPLWKHVFRFDRVWWGQALHSNIFTPTQLLEMGRRMPQLVGGSVSRDRLVEVLVRSVARLPPAGFLE